MTQAYPYILASVSGLKVLPEMMDAMRGISDDETVQEDVQERIDENMEEQAAEHSDIDDIFDN